MLDITGLLSESTYQCTACISGMYEISLTVSKGEIEDPARRQASAKITVKIVPGPAQVSVGVIPPVTLQISPSLVLKLDAILVPPREDTKGLTYSWGLANAGVSGCCIGQLNMSRGGDFPLGVSSPSLMLLPGMLSSGVAYIFAVTVRDVVAGTVSTAQLQFIAARETMFSATCESWTADPDSLPLQYEFGYTASGADPAPIDLTFSNGANWTSPASAVLVQVTIWADARDTAGSLTRRERSVTLVSRGVESLEAAAATAQSRLTVQAAAALALLDASATMQQVDVACSTLNLASPPPAAPLARSTPEGLMVKVDTFMVKIETRRAPWAGPVRCTSPAVLTRMRGRRTGHAAPCRIAWRPAGVEALAVES
ncbi:hypothetical protein T484DRAFT_1767043 [Baffinella frigidus]|nr:hypothetical protein T484DRAFT_1767043 [Cryptophyta sp. CCMP2293]